MGAPRNPGKKRRTKRTVRDLAVYQRSAALANLRRAAEAVSAPNFPPASIFSPWALWRWVKTYLPQAFAKKHVFPSDAGPARGLHDLRGDGVSPDRAGVGNAITGTVRISMAGDWGTGTAEAQAVAEHMKAFQPHFTIHLGDVYPVGDARSVQENCLGIRNPKNNYDPVRWPMGSVGAFALNGNHEMFANGSGYFDVLLPAMGMMGAGGQASGQPASFFCLQNDDWQIIGLDTGYNSGGVPILSGIPWVNSIPGICGDCRLEKCVVDWIANVVEPGRGGRGLILLSHHQNYSGFEDWYRKPAKQLWEAGVRRPVLWFWGHEHRLAGYDLCGTGELKSYGRCIGHGGMPVERERPTHEPAPVFYDFRAATNGFGVNGFVNLTFQGRGLAVSYVDMDGIEVVREEFAAAEGGVVRLESRTKLIDNPDFPCTEE
jgi:hypothetical protein